MLDDSGKEEHKKLAEKYGCVHLSRPNKGEYKKSGNLEYGYAHSDGDYIFILDADFRIGPMQGIEKQSRRIGSRCNLFLAVSQRSFRFCLQRFLLLLYYGDRVIVSFLCSYLFLAWTTQKAESYQ